MISPRIRVLHCIETMSSGGVEQRRLLLSRTLDSDRYEQQIVCTKASGPLQYEFEREGVIVHQVGNFRHGIFDLAPYFKAVQIAQKFRPHIIHGAVFGGTAIAVISGRLAKVNIRIAEETSSPTNRSWRGQLLIRALYAGAHRVVAISPDVNSYLSRLGIPLGKRVLINNGVLTPRTLSSAEVLARKAELGLRPKDFVVGFVGRLHDNHKRVSDLIEALAMLAACDVDNNFVLLIVGDGPDRPMLEDLAQARGVSKICRFVGYQNDTAAYYALMNVFVLPSEREGFGLVVAEAMLSGIPVVATRVGGIPMVLDEGRAGILVAPRAPDQIACAVRSLLERPDMRRNLIDKARDFARANHTAERYAADVANLYENLLAGQV